MAQQTKVAARYARAIFDYLGDLSKNQKVMGELRALADVVDGHEDLSLVFVSEAVSRVKREEIIEDLSRKLKLSSEMNKVLKVLSYSKRLGLLRAVAEEINNLLLQAEDVISVRIEAANDLDASEKKLIEDRFENLLNKKIEATYVVDPQLIGGIRVTAAGRTYNGTLAGWFDTIEEKLVGG